MLHLARDALRRFLDVPKFPTPEAEEAFWVRDDARKYEFRCYALLAGVIAYAGFAAVDVIIAGEVLEKILWIRAASSCIAFLLWLLFLTPRSHREREAIIFAYGAVLVAANIWMSTIAVPPAADYLPFSLSLCLAFGVGLIVLRLRTVAALSILGCAAYWLSVPYSNTSTGALAVNAHFLTISVFAALVGSFARERLEREQALTEAQLENLRIRAEEANLAKDRLLASVSHELRTPVNALLGFSEMMRGEVFGPVSPPRYRDYIDDMHFSAGLLRNSIDDLLELSRLQMEKAAWKESEFLLEQVVATSVAICEGDARQAGITLRLEEPEDETLLTGDPQRLTQTIVNVITNAVKFSSEGGEVRVTAGRDGEDYRISVSDSGCGIPPEALDRIFEPFAQAHADCYSAGKGGLGLGLTIASRILARLDGRLAIESAVGVGTTVSIHLPGHRLRAMPCVAVPRARAG